MARTNTTTRADALRILGLPAGSTPSPDRIKAAFRNRIRLAHPDSGGDGAIGADIIVEAKDTLLRLCRTVDRREAPPSVVDVIVDLADAFYGGHMSAAATLSKTCPLCSGLGRTGSECHACSNYKPTILFPKSHCTYCDDTGYADLCTSCRGTGVIGTAVIAVLQLRPCTMPNTLVAATVDGNQCMARISIRPNANARMERGMLIIQPVMHLAKCITGCDVDILGRALMRFPSMHFSSFQNGNVVIEPQIVVDAAEHDILLAAARSYLEDTMI